MKNKKAAKTSAVEIPGTEVKQTNQLFLAIREIGHLDENGRKIFSVGYRGKTVAQPDKPLSTMVWALVTELVDMARYTSDDAAKEDVELFKKYVNTLHVSGASGGTADTPA